MRRWIVTSVFLGGVIALMAIFFINFGNDPRAVPFLMAGKQAPAFTLREIATDKPVSLSDYQGKPIVLNFWASWCGPCKLEHPSLEWGNRQFGHDVQFLGMVFEDTLENARGFLSQYGASFPQLLDPNSMTSVAYGVSGVPETYFITADGVILEKHVGPIPPQVLAEKVRKLMALKSIPAASAQGGVK